MYNNITLATVLLFDCFSHLRYVITLIIKSTDRLWLRITKYQATRMFLKDFQEIFAPFVHVYTRIRAGNVENCGERGKLERRKRT